MPTKWAAFVQNVRRYQADKVNPWLGFRNAIGVTLPLVGGAAFGSIPAGLAMSSGALNVAFRDSDAPYSQRARQLLAGSIVAGLTVFAATLCGASNSLALVLTTVWAFAAGMLVAVDQSTADLGVMSLVMLLVYAAVPQTPQRAALAGLFALAGGLLQAALALALWRVHRYGPERRALGNLYLALARAAASPPENAAQAPPATPQSLAAQNAFAALERDHSVESERFQLLLIQAERMRLALLALSRLRARIGRDAPGNPTLAALDRYLELYSNLMNEIGRALIAEAVGVPPAALEELDRLADGLRQLDSSNSALDAMIADARFQMDALTGQLRAAIDLERSTTMAGATEFARREGEKPRTLRLLGILATIRANLTLESAAFRHAIRLAVCVLLGDALAREFGLRRPYWLPMTIAIVLKPDFTATFSRGVLRLAGTFTGLVFATILVHILPQGIAWQIAMIAVLMFIVRCFGGANYGILATSITALVVFLIALGGPSAKELIAARAVNTVIGGVIALLAYSVWPTWERTQVSEAIARMLDGYRAYVRALLNRYDADNAGDLDRARVAGRLARTNLEASIDRFNAEPGASSETIRSNSAVLASSHRLAHALMALEAGLATARSKPPRETFARFASDVEKTLFYLSSALRGSAIPSNSLPDLREAHRQLVQSGDQSGVPSGDQYGLVAVETDRVTNSLNTLKEELMARTGNAASEPAKV
jgi:uncharacterized membrane protein YccC